MTDTNINKKEVEERHIQAKGGMGVLFLLLFFGRLVCRQSAPDKGDGLRMSAIFQRLFVWLFRRFTDLPENFPGMFWNEI